VLALLPGIRSISTFKSNQIREVILETPGPIHKTFDSIPLEPLLVPKSDRVIHGEALGC